MSELENLGELPGELTYRGEFGAELVLFLPFVTWLSDQGLLRQRRVSTYKGMGCFYDELDCAGVVYRDEVRREVEAAKRPAWLPVTNEHTYGGPGPNPRHRYPDLRSKFLARPLHDTEGLLSKPLLVIHNKYNIEWSRRVVNFMSEDLLETIFGSLEPHYSIVYIRHGLNPPIEGFSPDRWNIPPFGDRAVLDRHPLVREFDALFTAQRAVTGLNDVNDYKNRLYARCHDFLTVQGGGAHHIAMFSGARMGILHFNGQEANLAYNKGYYGFMASPPPERLVRLTEAGLLKVVQAMVEGPALAPAPAAIT